MASAEMTHVVNISYGLQMAPLTDDKAAEYIAAAEARLPQIGLSYVKLDKPKAGQCILVSLLPQQSDLPSDGYHWQDGETIRRASTMIGKDLEIFSRDQGFVLGEGVVSVRKRRYRFADGKNQLILIHYLAVEPNAPRIPVNPAYLQMAQNAALAAKKKKKTGGPAAAPVSQAPAAPQIAEEDLSGDELDTLTQRDISTIRYKRNHEYLDELFSPMNTTEVITSHKDIFDVEGRKAKAEEWKKKHAEALDETKRLEKKHAETKAAFQRKSEFTLSRLDKTIEAEAEYCKEFHVKIVPAAILTKLK